MAIAAQHDESSGLGVAEELVQPCTLQRKVHPLFPAVVLGNKLNARAEQPHLGRNLELLLEPFPLRVAEHAGFRIGVGNVRSRAGGRLVAFLERAPMVASIKQDDLDALSRGPKNLGAIDALLLAA